MVSGAGALIVWAGAREEGDPTPVALPIATALLCVWLCFLFEDLAAETVGASPTPLAFRRALRVAVAVPATVLMWLAFTWLGTSARPTVQMVGSMLAGIALSLAAGAVTVPLTDSNRGGYAAIAIVVFVLLVLPVAIGRPPSIDPATPPLGDPFTYWAAITSCSCVVLALAHMPPFQRR
ncbi:MAG TPA: hypothetical protein VI341_10525 [Actinomycetota bacterium]